MYPNIEKTGAELCLYEPHRIQIFAMIYWNSQKINIKIFNGKTLDYTELHFILSNQVLDIFFNTKKCISDDFDHKQKYKRILE